VVHCEWRDIAKDCFSAVIHYHHLPVWFSPVAYLPSTELAYWVGAVRVDKRLL